MSYVFHSGARERPPNCASGHTRRHPERSEGSRAVPRAFPTISGVPKILNAFVENHSRWSKLSRKGVVDSDNKKSR
jgi:hypothetical protein